MLVVAAAALEITAAPKATAALAAAGLGVLVRQIRRHGLEPQEQLIQVVAAAVVVGKPASALALAVQAALVLSFSVFQLQVTVEQQPVRQQLRLVAATLF